MRLSDTACGNSLAVGSVLGVLPEAELVTGTSAGAASLPGTRFCEGPVALQPPPASVPVSHGQDRRPVP